MKPIRKAVRTFLINNNKVLTIKYNDGFYDVPGGKIEDNENSIEAALREFKEETLIEIKNPKYAGNLIIEYPDRIYDLDIYLTCEYIKTDLNDNWIEINELLNNDKLLPVIHLLEKSYYNELINLTNFKFHFISDLNHNIINKF